MINKAFIIDDDRLYVSLIKMFIQKNKLAKELLVFENGKIAIQYLENELQKNQPLLPEVILLDLNMPVMDGWEFLEAIGPFADHFRQYGLQLNVVSSTINPMEVRKANSHEFVNSFLTKPVNKEAMIKAFTKNHSIEP